MLIGLHLKNNLAAASEESTTPDLMHFVYIGHHIVDDVFQRVLSIVGLHLKNSFVIVNPDLMPLVYRGHHIVVGDFQRVLSIVRLLLGLHLKKKLRCGLERVCEPRDDVVRLYLALSRFQFFCALTWLHDFFYTSFL